MWPVWDSYTLLHRYTSAQDQMEDSVYSQMQYFTDSTVAWENTLSALQKGTGGPNMVEHTGHY